VSRLAALAVEILRSRDNTQARDELAQLSWAEQFKVKVAVQAYRKKRIKLNAE
jgi:hypothetical protein